MTLLTAQQKRILVYLGLSIVVIIFLGLFFSAYGGKIIRRSPLALPRKSPHGINILIVGVDNDINDIHRRRSDTIILANINPQKNKVSIISIPRDARVAIPGYAYNKINHAYYYGGIRLLKKTVSDFLQIDIPYYLIIDNIGVRHLIDALGGIQLNVEERMRYTDRAGGLYIDLYPGWQTLNGRKAEQYIRFRGDVKADIGRIERQQKVIRAISGKLKNPIIIINSPRLMLTLMRFTESNIPWRYYLDLATQFKKASDLKNIRSTTIPTEPVWIDAISFQQPNAKQVVQIVQAAVYGRTNYTTPAANPVGPILKKPELLNIEILIGNGSAASLSKTYSALTTFGYKIATTRYAGRQDYQDTILVNWHGEKNRLEALLLASRLGIKKRISWTMR